jgi:hypothetical protein
MAQAFPYTYTCEVCGGTFYSKVDPSSWHHHKCNKCSGKQYRDYPVEGTQSMPVYQPKPVPTSKPVYNNVQPVVVPKKEFNLDEYITDIIATYIAISNACDEAKLTIPVENLCAWTTGALIQKGKFQ